MLKDGTKSYEGEKVVPMKYKSFQDATWLLTAWNVIVFDVLQVLMRRSSGILRPRSRLPGLSALLWALTVSLPFRSISITAAAAVHAMC